MYVYMYVCIYVCMHVCVCVCVYVCMYGRVLVYALYTVAHVRSKDTHTHSHSINDIYCSWQWTRPFFCFSVNLYRGTKFPIVLLCCVVSVALCRVALLCVVLRCVVVSSCFVLLFVVLCFVVSCCFVLCLPHRGRWTSQGSTCFPSAPDTQLF